MSKLLFVFFLSIFSYSQAEDLAVTVKIIGTSTLEVSCLSSIGGTCNYLILSPLCEDKDLGEGKKQKTCHYTAAAPLLKVRSGEKKSIANLPGDFLYCVKYNTIPTAMDCINNPVQH
ncbi:hypothetical protein ACO0K7_02210 [Undibacterium sp. Ji67W]|uniref:hypothetical protein n=1 Tax=Undibacterium sp. Ji67W TaxID=3413042 RepID=UPI003BF272EC